MDTPRTSPSLVFFSCPELYHIIALHLNQTDLYSCLLVNKTLSKNLFPYLWRNISFHDFKPYYSEFYVLDKQKEREQERQIRSSKVGGDTELKDKDDDKLSKATTITLQRPVREERPYERQSYNPWKVPAIQQDISEFYFPFSPPYSQLVKHGHLIETLTLEWNEGLTCHMNAQMRRLPESKQGEPPGLIQIWIYIRLMEQCTNVRVLKIVGRNAEWPCRTTRGWCGTGIMKAHRRREESLSAKDMALAKVVAAAGRLGFGMQADSSSSSIEDFATLPSSERTLMGPSGIRELHLLGSCAFKQESFKALIQAFSPSPLPSPAATMSSSSTLPNPYPRHHRQAQLRVLDISGCEYLQSDRMYILLTCLPGLQVVDFRCRQHLYQLFSDSGLKYDRVSHLNDQKEEDEDEDEEEGYVFAKMTRGSRDKRHGYGWACQNSLQVLKVGVNDVVMQYKSETPDLMVMAGSAAETAATGIKYYDNNKSCTFDVLTQLEYPACFHWFYNSIAQLTHLRELCLVSVTDPFDLGQMTREVCLTLKEGLDLWEGLKELEVLDVEYLNHQIGIEEVQWMVKCWPRLKVIRGLIFQQDVRSNNADEGVDVNMEMEEDEEENEKGSKAWSEGVRWLKATRPDIELPVLEKRWKSALLLALEEEGDEDLLRDDG